MLVKDDPRLKQELSGWLKQYQVNESITGLVILCSPGINSLLDRYSTAEEAWEKTRTAEYLYKAIMQLPYDDRLWRRFAYLLIKEALGRNGHKLLARPLEEPFVAAIDILRSCYKGKKVNEKLSDAYQSLTKSIHEYSENIALTDENHFYCVRVRRLIYTSLAPSLYPLFNNLMDKAYYCFATRRKNGWRLIEQRRAALIKKAFGNPFKVGAIPRTEDVPLTTTPGG